MITQLVGLSNARSKHQNKKIVLTSGTFDLLHVGHLRYLNSVKALGGDDRVKARKGPQRPVILEQDRAQMLDAFFNFGYHSTYCRFKLLI